MAVKLSSRQQAQLAFLQTLPPKFQRIYAVIEEMEHWGGASAKSAMTWAKGDMQKVTVLTGWLAHAFHARNSTVVLVPPSEWKGQLPKDVVQYRVEKRMGKALVKQLGPKSHAWDALGIGYYAMERKLVR